MLRGIFRRKQEEIIIGWRNSHRNVLHKLYSSPNIIGRRDITVATVKAADWKSSWLGA
jgi:hypothetical protein